MISKELLSKILNEDVSFVYKNLNQYNMVEYVVRKSLRCRINVHELAHKCKEWAITKGYFIVIKINTIEITHIESNQVHSVISYMPSYLLEMEFKACQWVLDNV